MLRTDTRRAAAPHAPPRLRILAVAGEHAREAITAEVALRLAAAIGANESAAVDWAIMPLVNVGGRRCSGAATTAGARTSAAST